MSSDPVRRTLSKAPEPDLCVGAMDKQAFGCRIVIPIHVEGACLDVNSHELALVARLDVRPDVAFVNGLPAPGELFFAEVSFQGCPSLPPRTSTKVAVRCLARQLG
jgi:hypothetical protein